MDEATGLGSNTLSRRKLLQRGAAGGMALGVGGFLAACGGSSKSSTSAAKTAVGSAFKASPGSDIPAVDVKFAMWPYGDTTIGAIGMAKDWFKDVGITLPNGKET